METIGKKDILQNYKTAFLCSRRYPSSIVSKAYEWAIARREAGDCVISGFHSDIERDVFHYLIKGRQPVIMVLARGIYRKVPDELQTEIKKERLLVISPFSAHVKVSNRSAMRRNNFMADLADSIVVAHASSGGGIEKLIKGLENKGKKVGFI